MIELIAVVAALGAVAYLVMGSPAGKAKVRQVAGELRPATLNVSAAAKSPGRLAMDAFNEAKLDGAAKHIEDALGRSHATDFLRSLADLAGPAPAAPTPAASDPKASS